MSREKRAEPFRVRAAVPADLEGIVRVDRECFSIPWTRGDFLYELTENPRALYYVLTDEKEEICGYCGCRYVLDEAEVMNIAVLARNRLGGGGQLLLSRLLCELKERKVRRLTLEVREHNEAALALYRKNGFELCGKIRAYYRDSGEDALIMACKLP